MPFYQNILFYLIPVAVSSVVSLFINWKINRKDVKKEIREIKEKFQNLIKNTEKNTEKDIEGVLTSDLNRLNILLGRIKFKHMYIIDNVSTQIAHPDFLAYLKTKKIPENKEESINHIKDSIIEELSSLNSL